MTIFEKLCYIADWEVIGTPEETFQRECGNLRAIPDEEIVDVVFAGGIVPYCLTKSFNSQAEVKNFILKIFKKTMNSPALNDKKIVKTFPLFETFYLNVRYLYSHGKADDEANKRSEQIWFGSLMEKNRKEKLKKLFSVQSDETIFNETVKKIKQIWQFTDKDIDAFRYFVCQVKNEDLNPSLNKCLYLWSKKKETGKTSIARAIISVLNGEENVNNISLYESNISKELQFYEHDLPVAAYSNAVLLDEAMPNDTKKIYGQLKSVITSRGCKYNPKFNSVIHLDCRRNYLFTSNEDISEFIKDDSDRRFIVINNENKPEYLTFDEIFNIWKLFCIHATPRMNFPEWYSEFDFIEGIQTKDKSEIISSIVNNASIVNELENSQAYQISIGYFYRKLSNSDIPQRDVKKIIRLACEELFGNYFVPSCWKRTDILKKIKEFNKSLINDSDPFEFEEEEEKPPF